MYHLRRLRIPYFRIWYSSTFTLLFIATLAFLLVTPGDLIYQSVENADNLPNAFAIGGTTVLTAVVAISVYSTRLYTNRSVLAAIPKAFIPIERGEVGRNVRKLIVREWHRSALVAWGSRPRDTRSELQCDDGDGGPGVAERIHKATRRRTHIPNVTVLPINAKSPPWGHIEHAGWGSPASDDLPDLQFSTVVEELPNLIEAKAVSLTPPDPTADLGLPTPDARVVALLQRLPGVGIREYLDQLSRLGLVNPPALGAKFVKEYEAARFSSLPPSEAQFRQLTATFADVLSGMTDLDPGLILDILEDKGMLYSGPASTGPSVSPSQSSGSDAGSVRRYQTPGPYSASARTPSMGTMRTAPSRRSRLFTPGLGVGTVRGQSRLSARSGESFSRTRAEVDDGYESSESSGLGSLRSAQSVIRHSIN